MSRTDRVSITKRLSEREAPRWLLIVIAIVGVIVLVYFGRQALMGREGEPGPRLKVHPGMYDLRAEVAKMRAARQEGSAPNGR
jgi:hypothetical protein